MLIKLDQYPRFHALKHAFNNLKSRSEGIALGKVKEELKGLGEKVEIDKVRST